VVQVTVYPKIPGISTESRQGLTLLLGMSPAVWGGDRGHCLGYNAKPSLATSHSETTGFPSASRNRIIRAWITSSVSQADYWLRREIILIAEVTVQCRCSSINPFLSTDVEPT